jgi:hypothetical protein
MLGRTIRSDEVEDTDVVSPMVDLAIALAPHLTLDEKLRKAGDADHVGSAGQYPPHRQTR